MARCDLRESKSPNVSHGFGNDLLIAARQMKTARDRVERDRWEAGLSVLKDIDHPRV